MINSNHTTHIKHIKQLITLKEKHNMSAAMQYLTTLKTKLSNTINSVAFKTEVGKEKVYRYHRKGSNAKTLNVPSLANRSVKLNLTDASGNTKPTVATSKQGSMIISKPAPEGVLISLAHEVYDMEVDGSITDLSMEQELSTLFENIDSVITTEILKTITQSTYKDQYIKPTPFNVTVAAGARLKEQAEALQEALFLAKANASNLGQEMNDFTVGVSASAYSALEFVASVQGHKSVDDMMGTMVFPFAHDSIVDDSQTLYGYLTPKRHSGVSFVEEANGEVFKTHVTRVPERQSAIMEITANATLLIAGFTKLTVDTNGTAGTQVDVAMPLISRFGVITA